MTEQKKPQAGEFWKTRGGERRYVLGMMPGGVKASYPLISTDDCQATETHDINGRVFTDKDSEDDLVEHLPWCTSFDDVEQVAEVWPKYYMPASDRTRAVFHRRDSRTNAVGVNKDGTEWKWAYEWTDQEDRIFVQITESEALARLNPPATTCPDCNQPLTPGHAEECAEAWFEITDWEHEFRVGVDQFSCPPIRWTTQESHHVAGTLGEYRESCGSGGRCRTRRKNLPPLPTESRPAEVPAVNECSKCGEVIQSGQAVCWAGSLGHPPLVHMACTKSEPVPQPSTPDPGDGWRLIDKAVDVPQEGDQVNCCIDIEHQCWANHQQTEPFDTSPVSHYRRRITPATNSPFGDAMSEPDTVVIQFMVPRRILDGGDWPVRAVLAGGQIEDTATWLPVTIDRLGYASVRRPQ